MATSQKSWTTSGPERIGSTYRPPMIAPMIPMNRLRRPTRIALMLIRTKAMARASVPADPTAAAPTLRSSSRSSARLFVSGPEETNSSAMSSRLRSESGPATASMSGPSTAITTAITGNSGLRALVAL